MLKLIIGRIVVVSNLDFWLILLDMISLSECYLNKLMIVINYLCSSHLMFGHNSPKHKLMPDLKLGILREIVIYTNDILLILV